MKPCHLVPLLIATIGGNLCALTTATLSANPLISEFGLDLDYDGQSEIKFFDRARLTTGSNFGYWHQRKEFVGFVDSGIEIAINLDEGYFSSNPALEDLVFIIGVVPHRFELGDNVGEILEDRIFWSDIERYNGLRIFEYEIGSEIDRRPLVESPPVKDGGVDLGELWQESGYIGFRHQSDSGEYSYGIIEVNLDYDSALFGLTGYAITDQTNLVVTAIPEASTGLVVAFSGLLAFVARRRKNLERTWQKDDMGGVARRE